MSLEYCLLEREDIEETTELVTDVFVKRGVLITALGITEDQFRLVAESVCLKGAEEGNSLIVKDNGKVVGFCINEDYVDETLESQDSEPSQFDPISAILKECDNRYRKENIFNKGQLLYISVLGVDDDHLGKGIAKSLLEETIYLAAEQGFKGIISNATAAASQHIFKDTFRFDELGFVSYKYFRYHRKKPFSSIKSVDGVRLVQLWLGNRYETQTFRAHEPSDELPTQLMFYLSAHTSLPPSNLSADGPISYFSPDAMVVLYNRFIGNQRVVDVEIQTTNREFISRFRRDFPSLQEKTEKKVHYR
ncbi:MAG: GNAT family N-acetyltransferase [Nanoarchaeota archaeon]